MLQPYSQTLQGGIPKVTTFHILLYLLKEYKEKEYLESDSCYHYDYWNPGWIAVSFKYSEEAQSLKKVLAEIIE